MPRYFFDTDDGDRLDRDDTGQDLPDLKAARDTAIDVLPDMARDVLPDGDRRDITCVVRTEHDGAVFRAKLSLTAEWIGAHEP